jgi:hypothetical protein
MLAGMKVEGTDCLGGIDDVGTGLNSRAEGPGPVTLGGGKKVTDADRGAPTTLDFPTLFHPAPRNFISGVRTYADILYD